MAARVENTPRVDAVLAIENNFGAIRDAVGSVMDGVTPDEAHADMVSALTRLARELERDNIVMAKALCEIDAHTAGLRFLDEAFNSGDGVYRP